MAQLNQTVIKPPTALEQLLEEINFQRTKEMRQYLKDGNKLKIKNKKVENSYFRLWFCDASGNNLLDRFVCKTFFVPKRLVY